jgi:prophage antirepressor-like protein
MNNIITHTFKQTAVRTVERDNIIWFVASDIAKALDFRDAEKMTRILDDDERGTHIVGTPSGDQEMIIINESGLYHALIKSRKPEAVPFRKWVTGEVLPTIRKTGSYELPHSMTTSALSEDAKSQIGGIVKGIVYKAINATLEEKLCAMVDGIISSREISVRRGVTAGQVWTGHGLPQVKNGPQWLSGKLVACNCLIESGGRGELGGKTAKLFDPDKASKAMKHANLLEACRKYVSERAGQMALI